MNKNIGDENYQCCLKACYNGGQYDSCSYTDGLLHFHDNSASWFSQRAEQKLSTENEAEQGMCHSFYEE